MKIFPTRLFHRIPLKPLLFLLFPLTGIALFGQLPSESGTRTVAELANSSNSAVEFNILEIIKKGGIMMYPLAILSITALVLILLYFLTIRRANVVSARFMKASEAMIRNNDTLGLLAYLSLIHI